MPRPTHPSRRKRAAAKAAKAKAKVAKLAKVVQFPCPPGTADRLTAASASFLQLWFLANDNSGHGLLVPADRRDEFEAWLSLSDADEASWTTPSYAYEIDGERLEFQHPTIDGVPLEGIIAGRAVIRGGKGGKGGVA